MIRSQSSIRMSSDSGEEIDGAPALLKAMCSPPKCDMAWSTIAARSRHGRHVDPARSSPGRRCARSPPPFRPRPVPLMSAVTTLGLRGQRLWRSPGRCRSPAGNERDLVFRRWNIRFLLCDARGVGRPAIRRSGRVSHSPARKRRIFSGSPRSSEPRRIGDAAAVRAQHDIGDIGPARGRGRLGFRTRRSGTGAASLTRLRNQLGCRSPIRARR